MTEQTNKMTGGDRARISSAITDPLSLFLPVGKKPRALPMLG